MTAVRHLAFSAMNIDLRYLPVEDRMQLTLRNKATWLLTRSLLLRLVSAWLQRLEATDLPDVGLHLGERNLQQEHALSLEFDGPQMLAASACAAAEPATTLLLQAHLTVDALGASLELRGQTLQASLNLTRKESHLLLEMLAHKARAVGWLAGVDWPEWLGSHAEQSEGTQG